MRINPASFLPHLKGLRFDHIEVSEGHIVLTVTAIRATAAYGGPFCQDTGEGDFKVETSPYTLN